MVLPTIFSAHAPAAQHRARRHAAGVAAPAVTLSPLDAFLLTRLAAFLPHPLTVLDLAADATDGDSVAILHAAEVAVVSPRIEGITPPHADWRPLLRAERNGLGRSALLADTDPVIVLDTAPRNGTGDWEAVARALPTGDTTLVLLAETTETAAHTGQHLAWLAERLPDAPVLLMPLGATGAGAVLAQAITACPPGSARRLVALREQAPFFATSELGLVFSPTDETITTALERLTALVTGNFQFLTLVRDAVTTATHITAVEAELARVQEGVRAQTETVRAQSESLCAQTEMARVQADRGRVEAEHALQEKSEYAEWLESRLTYLEEEYIPWKNTVLTGFETELRNLNTSKALLAERVLRRLLRRR